MYRKGSKHIDIRYCYVTDCVKRGKVEVIYCPKEVMIADYCTKPLQGKLFVNFRNAIQGIDPEKYHSYSMKYLFYLKAHGLAEGYAADMDIIDDGG